MSYTLGQAAKAVHRSKTTIHRAIQAGRLSARLDEGVYVIDPAELFRVYDPAQPNLEQSVTLEEPSASLVQVEGERDRYRALAEEREETIRDLRARLDAEAAERRKLTAVLTGPRAPWWRRLFR